MNTEIFIEVCITLLNIILVVVKLVNL